MGFGVEVPTGGVTNFCGLVEREALEHLAWQIADRHIEHIVIAKIGHDIGEDVRAKLAHGIERFVRSEEHPSALQSLLRIAYAVFCLKKKKTMTPKHTQT